MSFKVLLTNSKAKVPTRGSALSAGYDLYSSASAVILARGRGVVPTGLKISIPEGTYARVAPRSGLAVKHGIDTGAGVVDADYRGEVGVVLFNNSDEDFVIEEGDRIAQLIIEKIWTGDVEVATELESSERGSGGFGSTGRK
ncbi:bifunctional dITP/dUTP diphosphatase [Starmerella bacillaris]|uniref:Deoxyuridine 5'-triphosphate nucleotidohydrolase n=1 Tax=Starmerella bacillaris TaxID=1247836 RepID=A0AAV5RDJ6_STABA|nr:bifunctional dITP/dUTP diphosphatase [Starmerella bacillaris]